MFVPCVRYGDLICDMALDAVLKVTVEEAGRKEIDIKKYAKVEKVRFKLALSRERRCAAAVSFI